MSLELLGAKHVQPEPRSVTMAAGAGALVIGLIGATLWRRHPVLGFLGAAALASNAHDVATGEATWKEAAERMGRHVVATAGSLALPAHPAIGYVGAAVAADLLLNDEGGGVIDRWAHRAGIQTKDAPRVIDAEIVPDNKSKALAKAA